MINRTVAFLSSCILTVVLAAFTADLSAREDATPQPGGENRDPRVDTAFFNGKDLAGWSTSQAKYWSVHEGAIVGQSPSPGTRLSPGSSIDLQISSGSPTISKSVIRGFRLVNGF